MKINLDFIYPVGSIYMSVNATNPEILFGGTWVTWGTGRVPVGVDTSQTEFAAVEKTGGSKYLQQHTHNMKYGDYGASSGGYYGVATNSQAPSGAPVYSEGVRDVTTGNSGNLQPYITCYMWKRTA